MHNSIIFKFRDFNIGNNMQLSSKQLLIKLSSVPQILRPGNSPALVKNVIHFFLVDRAWTSESDPVSSPDPLTVSETCAHFSSIAITPSALWGDCKK